MIIGAHGTAAERRVVRRLLRRVRAAVGDDVVTIEQVVAACAPMVGGIVIRTVPVELWCVPGVANPVSGVAVSRGHDRDDWILVRADVSGLHRDHIVAHELAHLLHHARDVSGGMSRPAVHGTGFCVDGREEREAEAFAEAVCTRLLVPRPVRDRLRYNWTA